MLQRVGNRARIVAKSPSSASFTAPICATTGSGSCGPHQDRPSEPSMHRYSQSNTTMDFIHTPTRPNCGETKLPLRPRSPKDGQAAEDECLYPICAECGF